MPVNAQDRERKILEAVEQSGTVSIQELAELLKVSAMTIHRDLNKMSASGLVAKTHGSVSLPLKRPGPDSHCAMCGKLPPERTAFIITLSNGEQQRACCAHCGLMLRQQSDSAWQAMTADFLHGHMISAGRAIYVIESQLTVCCVPSILSFGSRQEAERFRKGFGGKLADAKTTVKFLNQAMYAANLQTAQK